MKWIKRQKYHFNAVSGIKLDIIETYLCQFWRVLQEYVKAFSAPPMYTLALLRMGDIGGMQLFTSCSQDILDMELIYDEMY